MIIKHYDNDTIVSFMRNLPLFLGFTTIRPSVRINSNNANNDINSSDTVTVTAFMIVF